MTKFADELRSLRFSPNAGLPVDDFVARVMAACPTEAEPGRKPAVSRRMVWSFGVALAAAAAATLGVVAWPRATENAGREATITARGAGHSALGATVQAFVGHAPPGAAAPLLEGALLHPGDGILVRYSNPLARDVYLMVFALDEQLAVHWLHPAYVSDATNPTSLKLAREVTERVLPEVAEPENPAPGPLRVYALLSRAPLDVKSVESRLQAGTAPVAELFPEAEVEEWRCTWRAR